MTVKVEHLTGGYGKKPVIKDINFELKNGEIVGLIGLNGAGKSTTIKHMLGLLTPSSGELSISGTNIKDNIEEYRHKLSYIPEAPVIYEELTLQEHIDMTAMAYGIDKNTAMERANPLLKTFRLENELQIFPSHFSKGMKQKVMLVAAFMLERPLLIIDEPFLGLDTLAIKAVIDLMQEQARKGNSILLTTHLLKEATQFVDEFVVLYDGRIRFTGSPHHLAAASQLSVDNLEQFFESIQEELDDER